MKQQVTCTVHDERAATFERVFGSATVPVLGAIPQPVVVPELGQRMALMLDVAALTAEQRANLEAHLVETFGAHPQEVASVLDKVGMPILSDGCTVTVPAGLAMSMMPDFDDDPWDDEWDDFDDEQDDDEDLSF